LPSPLFRTITITYGDGSTYYIRIIQPW
jgi:hypothetical protein